MSAETDADMQMNRMMARLSNLGLAEPAHEKARRFVAESQAKIGTVPTVEKLGQGGARLIFVNARKQLVLDFHDNGAVGWQTLFDDEQTDAGSNPERTLSLVNWLIRDAKSPEHKKLQTPEPPG